MIAKKFVQEIQSLDTAKGKRIRFLGVKHQEERWPNPEQFPVLFNGISDDGEFITVKFVTIPKHP